MRVHVYYLEYYCCIPFKSVPLGLNSYGSYEYDRTMVIPFGCETPVDWRVTDECICSVHMV